MLQSTRVFYEHGGQASPDGTYRVLSVTEKLGPKEVCSETYLVVDSYEDELQCENLYRYLQTKFARYLVLIVSSSIMVSKSSYRFVPILDMKETWTDEKLYKHFDLSLEEQGLIEGLIKPIEISTSEKEVTRNE